MIVGIHVEPQGQFSDRLIRYEKILDFNRIEHIRVNSSDPQFWELVPQLDLFIYSWQQYDSDRQVAMAVIPVVENFYRIPCFPDIATSWHYDDKIRQYYLACARDLPMVKSWVFYNRSTALDWAHQADFPVVFKLKGGAGSKNVVLLKTRKETIRMIKLMFGRGVQPDRISGSQSLAPNLLRRIARWGYVQKSHLIGTDIPHRHSIPNWVTQKNYVLFQEFLPNNSFDTRVTVIGNKAFSFRRYNRPNDFRSSGSGLIDYDTSKIDLKIVEKSLQVSQTMNFQSMAYDFLYTQNNKIRFCEMSYTYIDEAIYRCPGYWDSNLNWHVGNYWPQYFHLMDVLGLPELKQPHNME